MKTLKLIVVLALMPLYAFAIVDEAIWGDYAIRHYPAISDYQAIYVGQTVRFLPSAKKNFNYDERFLKIGGNWNSDYVISKITGNDKKMTFWLTGISAKKNVKMVIENQHSYKNFYINNDRTVPLFLIGKFNQDKEKLTGKTFGDGAKLVITDALFQTNDGDDYPKAFFEITDKQDEEKSLVGAENIHNINELGKVFTDPSFKCNYTVVGITTKQVRYGKITQMYTVKNSISGKTKEVEALSASTGAFNGDDFGKFLATLIKVEKPSNPSVRYGTTMTVADKDVTKFSYADNVIDILIFCGNSQFGFVLKNLSDNTLKIIWNEAVFVDVDGSTSKVMHSGTKYSQREEDQPASTIIKGAKLDDIAAPTANVYYNELFKEWTSHSMYRNADKRKQGQTIKLMLPIQIKDVINEYVFEFGLTYKFDHPEYIAD